MPIPHKHRYTVFYDEYCPFCTFSKNFLSRTDYLHLLEFQGITSYSRSHGISAEMMMNGGIQVVRPGGRISSKNRGIMVLTVSNPLLFPIAVISTFLEAVGLGNKTYDMIAARRYGIGSALHKSRRT
jgi:predicted DCC family thiol-disulfide oxidoreductase YuxK